ncbi:MAG TPA: hypothetical protein HPP83_05900, partial [Candidatus Hydrogenedentes bacterium]|nr:hypothetical protein [Candidatus Hydrogenedentota bacterium]
MALAATGEVQERTAVGDDQLQVVLTHGVEGLAEVRYLVGGAEMPQLRGAPWAVETKDGTITPERDQVELVKKDTGRPARKATFQGEGDDFRWTLQYAVTGPGRITKSLTLMPISDLVLEKVGMWYAESPEEPEVASTTIQDIAAFYRHDNLGLFVSLDFPYSKIRHEDGQTGVFYPPHIQLNSGEAYSCHSLTIGATRQTGKKRYGFDLGEV